MVPTDDDPDPGPDLQDQVDDAGDPGGSVRYSYLYLTGVFLSIVGGGVAAVAFGFVTPDITVTATVSIGYLIEYAAVGLVVLFFFWTFAQVTNIVGIDFVAGVVGVVARIADNYRIPRQGDEGDEGDGEGGAE